MSKIVKTDGSLAGVQTRRNKMADVLEIVQGISQVMANTHDGAVDDNGEPIKIGLKREEDVAITDKRVMDGFKIAMAGDTLFIKYHGEVTMKEAKASGFESEMEQMIADISSFLKKEYKKVTGSALNLKKSGEMDAIVQTVGAHRCWVQATCPYTITSFGEGVVAVGEPSEDNVDDAIKKWLELGRKGKAPNDKRKDG
jgi:hypothetical protein